MVGPPAKAMIAAGSTVTPGSEVPPEVVAMGSPARKLVPLAGNTRAWVDGSPTLYQELARRHREGIEPVEG